MFGLGCMLICCLVTASIPGLVGCKPWLTSCRDPLWDVARRMGLPCTIDFISNYTKNKYLIQENVYLRLIAKYRTKLRFFIFAWQSSYTTCNRSKNLKILFSRFFFFWQGTSFSSDYQCQICKITIPIKDLKQRQ